MDKSAGLAKDRSHSHADAGAWQKHARMSRVGVAYPLNSDTEACHQAKGKGTGKDKDNGRLARNKAMTASFSRAIAEGLSAQQRDVKFDELLSQTIDGIYQASISG